MVFMLWPSPEGAKASNNRLIDGVIPAWLGYKYNTTYNCNLDSNSLQDSRLYTTLNIFFLRVFPN